MLPSFLSLTALACFSAVAHPAPTVGDPGATDDPAAVVAAFHRALSAGDADAAASHLHADVLVFEQGRAETLQQYRSGHLAADIRFASQTMRHVMDSRSMMSDGVAVLTSRTHVMGQVGDRAIDSQGVETMVLVQTDAGWKIHHIHWSSR